MSFNSIIGCLKYQKTTNETYLIYQCIECQEGYYFSNYKCKLRKNISNNVLEYDKSADQALKCQQGHYLNYEMQCKQNPTGILGCVIY